MNVLLGVTGSIAAYKAVELVRLMRREGWVVNVIMTESATRFIGPLTFRTVSCNPVAVDMFERPEDWEPGHISLADAADVMVVAPCTANVLAKMAVGIADDMLTCSALAFGGPLVVAPAMNEKMWMHEATQTNVETLKRRKARVMDVESGELACGYAGKGRMADPSSIVEAIKESGGSKQ